MSRIGLTGGIGSGKSTVAALLAGHGAAIVDADVVAREVVVPGAPAHARLVERFGGGVLAADGTIDRGALATLAFSDPEALRDLNAITHPQIGLEMARRLEELDTSQARGHAGAPVDDARSAVDGEGSASGSATIAVVVIPLLSEHHVDTLRLGAVVVVDCPVDVAVERLVQFRGMSEADARARIEAQITRDERLALADYVVDNSGDVAQLAGAVDELWSWLQVRGGGARQPPRPPGRS